MILTKFLSILLLHLFKSLQDVEACFSLWPPTWWTGEDNEIQPREETGILSSDEKYSHPQSHSLNMDQKGRQIEELFERVGIVNRCRRRLADSLLSEQGCAEGIKDLREQQNWQIKFSLEITNCHLQTHQKKTYSNSDDPSECVKAMTDTDFQIFTQFSIVVESLCSELSHERWQRSVEALVSTLHYEANVAAKNLLDLSEKSSNVLLKQDELKNSILNSTTSLKQHIEENVKKETSRKQEAAMLKLQNETEKIDSKIHDVVINRINQLDSTTAAISTKLVANYEVLSQHTATVKNIQEAVDTTMERWFPILEAIYSSSRNTHLTLLQLQTFLFYFTAGVALRTLTGFSMSKDARLYSYLFFICSVISETLVLPQVFPLDKFSSSQLSSLYWKNRTVFLVLGISTILFTLYSAYLKRGKYLDPRQAFDLLQHIQECVKTRENHNNEIIRLLIHQLVEYRLEQLKNHVVYKKRHLALESLLHLAPNGYHNVEIDSSEEPSSMLKYESIENPPSESLDVEEVFAPEGYGFDTHNGIAPLQ